MGKTIAEALKEAGFKAKVSRKKGWPRKVGAGRGGSIAVVIDTNRAFAPGTGFAFSFVVKKGGKKS